MTGKEIKDQCELIYAEIKKAENRLIYLREICKHEKTYEGNYSWRTGAHSRAVICEYCLKPVKWLEPPLC